jgi:hypothetical protein
MPEKEKVKKNNGMAVESEIVDSTQGPQIDDTQDGDASWALDTVPNGSGQSLVAQRVETFEEDLVSKYVELDESLNAIAQRFEQGIKDAKAVEKLVAKENSNRRRRWAKKFGIKWS